MDYKEEYRKWLSDGAIDGETKAELKNLPEEEIKDRFFKSLSFGTGGLRGVIGAGENRMNIYTVGKATQGLANFILSRTDNGSVVIAYDSRKMSKEFALSSALVLCANNIKVYLFEGLRPTPELSFAVRFLNATAGIVITASHNPPQYNGYKVYWSDGGQIVSPYDKSIIEHVNAVKSYSDIKRVSEEKAQKSGLLEYIGERVDDAYIAELKKLILNPEAIKSAAEALKIVYTPLNGTGNIPVRRILSELGFKNVYVVAEQESPDGNFPTLEYPNPEDKKAFTLALNLAKKTAADIVLATDPDADRLGIYVKDVKSGEYIPFTGNMSGLLIAEYEISQRAEKGLLPQERKNGALVTTIVSSKMAYDIAASYSLTVKEVLTGFKYIGEQIKLFEQAEKENGGLDFRKGAYEFIFGYEESYGCLVGTHSRDKDAVVAVMALCEAAAYYKTKGLTLCDQMQNIYKKYGYFYEDLESRTFYGEEGLKLINSAVERLRKNPPSELGGLRVKAVRDYLSGYEIDLLTGEKSPIILPRSNVIYLETEGDAWCCVRPSGTEPKIKFYFGAKENSEKSAKEKVIKIKNDILKLLD